MQEIQDSYNDAYDKFYDHPTIENRQIQTPEERISNAQQRPFGTAIMLNNMTDE